MSTKSLREAGLKRGGNPAYPDHKPNNKFAEQSAGAKRAGDNRIQDFPDVTRSTEFESTGNDWAGTGKGSR